jgi:hypothetical protein
MTKALPSQRKKTECADHEVFVQAFAFKPLSADCAVEQQSARAVLQGASPTASPLDASVAGSELHLRV